MYVGTFDNVLHVPSALVIFFLLFRLDNFNGAISKLLILLPGRSSVEHLE